MLKISYKANITADWASQSFFFHFVHFIWRDLKEKHNLKLKASKGSKIYVYTKMNEWKGKLGNTKSEYIPDNPAGAYLMYSPPGNKNTWTLTGIVHQISIFSCAIPHRPN